MDLNTFMQNIMVRAHGGKYETFTSRGTPSGTWQDFIIPAGVTEMGMIAVGPGGAGQGPTSSLDRGGGGGALAAHGYGSAKLPVTPHARYQILVPRAGDPFQYTMVKDQNGTIVLKADGGQSGSAANWGLGGAGGQAANCIGGYKRDGGQGAAGGGYAAPTNIASDHRDKPGGYTYYTLSNLQTGAIDSTTYGYYSTIPHLPTGVYGGGTGTNGTSRGSALLYLWWRP